MSPKHRIAIRSRELRYPLERSGQRIADALPARKSFDFQNQRDALLTLEGQSQALGRVAPSRLVDLRLERENPRQIGRRLLRSQRTNAKALRADTAITHLTIVSGIGGRDRDRPSGRGP